MRKAPRTVVQAQFSIPYTVAAAWVDGGVKLGHFADASFRREDLMALSARVDAHVDAEIERTAGRNVSPVAMEVETVDGAMHRVRIDLPLGHPERPMSVAHFDAKAEDCFRAAARPMPEGAATHLRATVDRLESLPDARVLLEAVRAAG
jgi:2-methylcitrate dehydratase PrpD